MDRRKIDRRHLLSGAVAVAGLAVAPRAMAAASESSLRAVAQAGLARYGASIAHRDVVGIADFSRASRTTRLHLIDMATGTDTSVLVAHGRGSDPAHTGWLQRFSNEPGSNCTSQGAYRTGDYYVGSHGQSMRLAGLDPTNSNAESRAIVVHGAWYVGEAMLREHGILGRSEGCFAVSQADLDTVLKRLGPGRLLIADKF